jgi:hypothetical protein
MRAGPYLGDAGRLVVAVGGRGVSDQVIDGHSEGFGE